MLHWLRRLTGRECCEEWTQWETQEADFSRPPRDVDEWIFSGHATTIVTTRRWQERRCTLCGRVQQRELRF